MNDSPTTPSSRPASFKELLKGATPGPWAARLEIGGVYAYTGPAHSDGKPRTCVADTGEAGQTWNGAPLPDDEKESNAQYIARLNPEVMRGVLEFLEECETAEDRRNLDGDSAEAVLEQINDAATKLLASLNPLRP